jgi:hypothetical protein
MSTFGSLGFIVYKAQKAFSFYLGSMAALLRHLTQGNSSLWILPSDFVQEAEQ